jgi:thioredoxin-like negative regulator of GroEL
VRTVTFYHSAICPRCRLASLFLGRLLPEYPGIRLERVEFLTNPGRARAAGVRSIPTLVSDGSRLAGFVLTRSGIRRFLDSLAPATE